MTDKEFEKLADLFVSQYNAWDYINGYGYGIDYPERIEMGIVLHFETLEKLKSFPFNEERFQGVPVYKHVTGKIRFL
jgi:hypothetical protein